MKLCLLFCCLFSTVHARQLYLLEGRAQGTYYRIKYLSADTASLQGAVDSIFRAVDQSLSLYQPASLINRFNQTGRVRMDVHLEAVVKKALYISRVTNGAFDITVKPLVDAWGFGVHRPAVQTVPAKDTLQKILQYVGYHHLRLHKHWLIKRNPFTAIDCDGIAQGYTTDVISRFLESRGVANYLVDVGGELRSKGKNQSGTVWTVGIERPPGDGTEPVMDMLLLPDKAITTSGNYRQFFEQGGQHFTHTIDPISGEAVHSNIISVTVIAPDAITADGFDNALLLMGVDGALAYIAAHPQYGLEAYFIYEEEGGKMNVKYSPGFKSLLL